MKYLFNLTLIILTSPIILFLILIIAVIIFFTNTPKIIFKQKRLGYKNRIFTLYKFQTMNEKKDKYGHFLPDEMRVTKVGKFLRYSRLDELPNIFNVIKNDLNFVGPRPLYVDYLNLYNNRQIKRHDVLPGITGWAQINGNADNTFDEKLELDIWYVDNSSFYLDIKILVITLFKILMIKNIDLRIKKKIDKNNKIN